MPHFENGSQPRHSHNHQARPEPRGDHRDHRRGSRPPQERPEGRIDNRLAYERIDAGHKAFFADLQQNDKGRYVKIAEVRGEGEAARRDTIRVDVGTLPELIEVLQRLLDYHAQNS